VRNVIGIAIALGASLVAHGAPSDLDLLFATPSAQATTQPIAAPSTQKRISELQETIRKAQAELKELQDQLDVATPFLTLEKARKIPENATGDDPISKIHRSEYIQSLVNKQIEFYVWVQPNPSVARDAGGWIITYGLGTIELFGVKSVNFPAPWGGSPPGSVSGSVAIHCKDEIEAKKMLKIRGVMLISTIKWFDGYKIVIDKPSSVVPVE